jgi:hypothetical protein
MSDNLSPDWFIPVLCQVLLEDPSPQNRILAAQTLLAVALLPQTAVKTLTYAVAKDPDAFVRAGVIEAIRNRYTTQQLGSLSDPPKVQMVFNAPVYGVTGNVEGNQIINTSNQEFEQLLVDYKQFIDTLQQKYPDQTPETAIQPIIDAEFQAIEKSQPQRWQNFLTLKRLWNGAKKAGLKVGEHFTEENLWGKAALVFLEGMMEKPE